MPPNLRSRQIVVNNEPFRLHNNKWRNTRMFTQNELRTFVRAHRSDENINLILKLDEMKPTTDIFLPLTRFTSNFKLRIYDCDFADYPGKCKLGHCTDLGFINCKVSNSLSEIFAKVYSRLKLHEVSFGTNAADCIVALHVNEQIDKLNVGEVSSSNFLLLSANSIHLNIIDTLNDRVQFLTQNMLITDKREIYWPRERGVDFRSVWGKIQTNAIVNLSIELYDTREIHLPNEAMLLQTLKIDLLCQIDNLSIPHYEGLNSIILLNAPIDTNEVNYWRERLNEAFIYNPDPDNEDSDDMSDVDQTIVLESDQYMTDDMKIIETICKETEDIITMENFSDTPSKIVTIIANSISSTGDSIAHCYNLDSLLKYWNEIGAMDRFELVGLRIYIDNNGYESLKQYKTQILVKVPDSDLYTLKPINRQSLLAHSHDYKQTRFQSPEPFVSNPDDIIHYQA